MFQLPPSPGTGYAVASSAFQKAPADNSDRKRATDP